MKPVSNWRRVLRHAWSVRLMLIAGVLTGAEAALPLLGSAFPIPQSLLAGLSFLAVGGGFVMRLIAQKEFSDADQ